MAQPRLTQLGFTDHVINGAEVTIPPMCGVRVGGFLIGGDPARDRKVEEDEMPQHRVLLTAYCIGRYPDTVAKYACFVRGGHAAPRHWQGRPQQLDHPVVSVSWHDAVAYAARLAKQRSEREAPASHGFSRP